MSLTIEIMRIIGSPFAAITKKPQDSMRLFEAYQYSRRNRIVLLFLEHVENIWRHPQLSVHYTKELAKYEQMLDTVSRVSRLLTNQKIDHLFYKTLRPYRSATVDVDTIISGNHCDYRQALETMRNSNYSMLAVGPMSATFLDPSSHIAVDLYDEVAVSALCYMDKTILNKFAQSTKLPNGENAVLLAPEADLLAIVAHSVIKEQMYTLSELYSFIDYLEKMDAGAFVDLVRDTNLTNAVRTHASITALLFETVFGETPKNLQFILETMGQDSFETSRISRRDLRAPHKYHQITLLKSLLEIMKGEKTRKSMAKQIASMFNPNFSSDFLKKFTDHAIRETY